MRNTTLQPFNKGEVEVGGWVLTVEFTGRGKEIARMKVDDVRDGREARIPAVRINTGDTNTER